MAWIEPYFQKSLELYFLHFQKRNHNNIFLEYLFGVPINMILIFLMYESYGHSTNGITLHCQLNIID
jgi:membrane-bound acyltransferase YfiQ involved in biofilm formation